MAAVLESPKTAQKQEEFVEKQINQASKRIRQLDYFSAAAVLGIAALVFVLSYLIVDRYVQTPRWTIWAVVAGYLLGSAGFLYLMLFRPSRRAINPYYAAKQVEDTLTDPKNSVVNWVDLKDDARIAGSVRTALGTKAAKDLKHVDLKQVIQKKNLIWLGAFAGVLFLATAVVAFLPPTRTQMTLLNPKDGDATVLQGEDLKIEVELRGRIPAKGQPDAARMRIWTNPETPNDYEERPLEPSEDDRRVWRLTIPAKQIRSGGFRYKLLAGNVQTPDYQVTLRIRPEFAGFVVNYLPPSWSKRAPDTTNDPNIVGFYGTEITLTAQINKPVRAGNLEVDGQVQLIPGQVVNEAQDALKFQFKLERNATYRIRFVTTENEKNTDAKTYTIKVLDAQPKFSEYEVEYKYPPYLRFLNEKITVREPNLEAMRGTEVEIVASANRPVKSAQLIIQGKPPIIGKIDKEEPAQVKFALPPLMEDGTYTLSFVPDTGEKEATSSPFTIKANLDQKPTVSIVKPNEEQIELPANGTLHVEGRATDDFGVTKVTLHMDLITGASKQPLVPKPYRDGKSLKSDKDGSYPTELEYLDVVELAKVKPDGIGAAGFQLRAGMIIEYWLEVEDNCTIEPLKDHIGYSAKQRVKILAPPTAPEKKKEQEQQNIQEEKDKQEHQKQQDEKLKNEKRDPKQKPKQGDQPRKDEPQRGGDKKEDAQPEHQPNEPAKSEPADPMGGKGGQQAKAQPQPRKNSKEDQEIEDKADELKNQLPPDQKMPTTKEEGPPPKEKPKADPKEQPKADPKNPVPPEPKNQPAPDMNNDQPPKPEDLKKLAEKLQSDDPKEREEAQKQIEQQMKQQQKAKPEAKKDAEKKLEEARNQLTPEQKKELDKAMQKAQENLKREQAKEEQQKKEEAKEQLEHAKDLAKKLDSKDKNEQQKAREEIEQMMKDQAKGKKDSTQQQKDDDLKQHLNEEERKELTKAREKISDEMQRQVKEQKKEQAQKNLEEMKDLNEKLKSKDADERKQAQQKLDKMMEQQAKADPEKSQKDSDEMRDNLQNEQQRQDFDKAQQNLQDAMQRRAQQKRQDDAEDHLHRLQETAKNLDSQDENERKKAEEDIERLSRENLKPKTAEEQKKQEEELRKKNEEMRKNLPNDEERQKFDQANKKVEEATKKKSQQIKQEQAQQQLDAMKNLAKDLDSKDENVKKAAQDKLEKMGKEQAGAKPEDAQKQKDDIRNNLKDDKQKQEFDQAQQKLAGEMRKQADAKRPKPDEIKQAAKDLAKDGESAEKQKAQEKLEDWMKDPRNKDQVEKGIQDAKKDMTAQEQKNLDKAMEQAKESGKDDGGAAAKNVAQQAKNLADKLNSKNPEEKKQAQDNLEKAMKDAAKDPKKQEQADKELNKVRDQLDKDQKAEFDKSMDQIAQHMKEKQPDKAAPKSGETGAPKPEDVKNAADKLAQKGDSPEKKEAQQKLEDWMRDPKNKDKVEQQMEQMAKDMKDPQKKENLEKAMKEAKENVAKDSGAPKGGGDAPKLKPEDVEKLAKELQAQGNGKDKQDAMKKLEEAMKDPKQRQEIEKQLDDMKKNLKDEQAKKEMDDAMKQMAKDLQQGKSPNLPKPEDIDKLAKQLQQKTDKQTQEDARKKLEDMMKDPKAREEIQKKLEDFKNNIKDDQAKKDFEQQLKNLADQLARNDKQDSPTKGIKDDAPPAIAELKHKLHAGEMTLDRFKREMTNEEFQKRSKMTPEQLAQFQKKYEEYLNRLRQDLEKMERQTFDRGSGASSLNSKEAVKLDPKSGSDPLQGGRYQAPPGFGDPYKKFTEEISGVKNPPKN